MSSTTRPHIGELDRRVIIENPTESQGSAGGLTASWATLATVWAKRIDQVAATDEDTEVAREVATTNTHWIVRSRTDVTEKMRISYGGDYYYITGMVEIGRKDFLNLKTETRDNG